jgi:hypothetical protein
MIKKFKDLKKGDILYEILTLESLGVYAGKIHLLNDPILVENEDEKYLYLLYDRVNGYSIPPSGYVISEDKFYNTSTENLVINKKDLYDRYVQIYEAWKERKIGEISIMKTKIDKIEDMIKKYDDLLYNKKELKIL